MSGYHPEWERLELPAPREVVVAGTTLRRGSRVRIRPRRGGDILDLALAGRLARVEGIDQDHVGGIHLALTIDEDPGRDLGQGRFPGHRFFFAVDEVDPIEDTAATPARRLLVAGIGNVFLGDDGFGVEVVRALHRRSLPPGVEVVDFGIRGMDLAYALQYGHDGAILIDALPRGAAPGTLVVLQPDLVDVAAPSVDGHAMDPVQVLALARRLGPIPAQTVVVGCEPAELPADAEPELRMELSPPVRAAVESAAELVSTLADRFLEHGRFEPQDDSGRARERKTAQ